MRDEIAMADADIEAAGQRPQAALGIRIGTKGIERTINEPWELPVRRWIDMLQARIVKRSTEAQYEELVRNRVDNLYTLYVDLQATAAAAGYAKVSFSGLEQLTKRAKELHESGQISHADQAASETRRALAGSAVAKAEADVRKKTLVLANLLSIHDAQTDQLKVVGDLENQPSRPEKARNVEELVQLGLHERPDLRAYRLGLLRAQLDWLRALLAPLNQIKLRPWMEGPNDSAPNPGGKATGWSLGAWITLPTSGAIAET